MHLSSVIAASFVALANAAPEAAYPRCHGDMEWDPVQQLCKCDRGEYYDARIQRCRIQEVQEIEVKKCREGERLYCVRGEGDYVPYHRENPYCWNDKHSKLICAKKNRVTEVFKHEIRKEYEQTHVAIEETEEKRHSCSKPRYYNYETKACECPRNKVWNGHSCGFPLLNKPLCPKNQHAYCAKSSRHIAIFAEHQELCQDNGKNYVFCCGAEHAHAEAHVEVHASNVKYSEKEFEARKVRGCLNSAVGHYV